MYEGPWDQSRIAKEEPSREREGFERGQERTAARERLREDLAESLRSPEGSFWDNIGRIGAAFALSGALVAGTPERMASGKLSEEFLEAERIERTKNAEVDDATLDRLGAVIAQKGGIPIAEGIETPTFKHSKLTKLAWQVAQEQEVPYFSTPKVMFGERFLREHPEEAARYIERIRAAMDATVILQGDHMFGSGAVIATDKGKFILTNWHVVKDNDNLEALAITGEGGKATVIGADPDCDLALVDADIDDAAPAFGLASETGVREGEKLAMVGHPMEFPFEVSIEEFVAAYRPEEGAQEYLISKVDERFGKEIVFEEWHGRKKWAERRHKNEIISGMSGGPIVRLEGGRPGELVGLNCQAVGKVFLKRMKKEEVIDRVPEGYRYPFAAGITADDIRAFLERTGVMKKPHADDRR